MMMCNACTQICRVIRIMYPIMSFIQNQSQIRNRNGWTVVILWIILFPALVACGTKEREFPGHTRDQVWKAMVQAADDPRYADWVVLDNKVWRDDEQSRLEILRDLVRDVVVPGSEPRREETEWKFSAQLTETDPPAVEFSTSTITVPAHFWLQARHYLDEVDRRLAGMPLEKKPLIVAYSSGASKLIPEQNTPLPVVASSDADENNQSEIAMPQGMGVKAVAAPVAAPVAAQVAVPVANPFEEPIGEPIAQSVAQSVAQPISEPVAQPISEPVAQPISEPVAQPISQPVAQPISEPVAQPLDEPIAQPVAQSVDEPVVQPVDEPVAQPVDEPIAQPVAQPVVQPVVTPKLNPVRGPQPDQGNEQEPVAESVAEPEPAPAVKPAPIAKPTPVAKPAPVVMPAVKPAPVVMPAPVVKPAPAPEPVEPPPFEPPPDP